MKRRIVIALASGLVWSGLGGGFAPAQSGQLGTYNPPQVRARSPISPYINLGPGGNAADYYGIVRPQIEAGKTFNQLQFGLANLADGTTPLNNLLPLNSANALGGLQTGHPVSFNNYQRFYPMTAGTVSGMPGTAGFGQGAGYGQTGYGQGGFGTPAYGQTGFGQTGVGGQGGRTFFPSTLGPSLIR